MKHSGCLVLVALWTVFVMGMLFYDIYAISEAVVTAHEHSSKVSCNA